LHLQRFAVGMVNDYGETQLLIDCNRDFVLVVA